MSDDLKQRLRERMERNPLTHVTTTCRQYICELKCQRTDRNVSLFREQYRAAKRASELRASTSR